MEYLDHLQWPAMLVTVAAQSKAKRQAGFWCFLASNLLWAVWGWHAGAWALIVLQFALAALNLRGVRKNEPA
jgi:hypothetical protein